MKIYTLTTKGRSAVQAIKSRYEQVKGEYGRNAFDRVAFEFSNIPACVLLYAMGNPSADDYTEMAKHGYASVR